ncbi:hypothetical protein M422DRAFT_261756 [Sphaerobolus stellatus SS14]|uniref:Uncharacterized protein n=1 Tax=Sphaerobolus stellatus (strain SS14) TaxID=990650 RepID=A0A0C9VEH8_SPHS4|nr:hypothetical protein M422DRAFT_261756 [Sphaerobolus stellatus SS14]
MKSNTVTLPALPAPVNHIEQGEEDILSFPVKPSLTVKQKEFKDNVSAQPKLTEEVVIPPVDVAKLDVCFKSVSAADSAIVAPPEEVIVAKQVMKKVVMTERVVMARVSDARVIAAGNAIKVKKACRKPGGGWKVELGNRGPEAPLPDSGHKTQAAVAAVQKGSAEEAGLEGVERETKAARVDE